MWCRIRQWVNCENLFHRTSWLRGGNGSLGETCGVGLLCVVFAWEALGGCWENVTGNINASSWKIDTSITIMERTITNEHTWKRMKINFMSGVVRSKEMPLEATKDLEEGVIWLWGCEAFQREIWNKQTELESSLTIETSQSLLVSSLIYLQPTILFIDLLYMKIGVLMGYT